MGIEHFAEGANNARDNEVLFHGTPEEFAPGDIVLPASKIGKSASANPDVAYATPSLYVAKFMAWEQNNHNGSNFGSGEERRPENVYRVEPVDPEEKLRRSPVLSDPTLPPKEDGYPREAPQVVSRAGFRVLSKLQGVERTLQLKSRLRAIEKHAALNETLEKLELAKDEQQKINDLREKQGFVPGEPVFRDPQERAFLMERERRTSGPIYQRIKNARSARHGEEKNTEFDGLLDELGYKKGE